MAELEALYSEYTGRLDFINCIGLGDREDCVKSDLAEVKQSIVLDVSFINSSKSEIIDYICLI